MLNGLSDCRQCNSPCLKVLCSRLTSFLRKEGCSSNPRHSVSAVAETPHETNPWGDYEPEHMQSKQTEYSPFLSLSLSPRAATAAWTPLFFVRDQLRPTPEPSFGCGPFDDEKGCNPESESCTLMWQRFSRAEVDVFALSMPL